MPYDDGGLDRFSDDDVVYSSQMREETNRRKLERRNLEAIERIESILKELKGLKEFLSEKVTVDYGCQRMARMSRERVE